MTKETMIEPKADASGEKLDAILSALNSIAVRVDEMEKNLPAPPLVTAADKKAKHDDDMEACDDDAKKDDDEEEMVAKKADKKAKKDAEGSDPKEHGKAGEIKPDDEGKIEEPGHMEFKKDDDEEEEAKKDDDEAAKMDEEEAKYADAQAKADSVLAGFGKSATRPLQGESLMAYRKRLLRGVQGYSDAYKGINLASIKDAKLLDLAEKQIFADALAASKAPLHYAADQLIELHEKDRAGRTITKFKGSVEAWLGDFKVPSLRVKEFHLNNNKR